MAIVGESDSESEDETDDENEGKSKNTQPSEDEWYPVQEFAVNKAILKEVEELEEKVFAASLQVKVSISYSQNIKMELLDEK